MMWGEYVPVYLRLERAKKEMDKLRKKGKSIEPIKIDGRIIAKNFWGKKWCDHIENFADFENRLPRGKAYVKNGSVCHLEIKEGQVEAFVSGSSLYRVSINIKTLAKNKWEGIKNRCSGYIGSILELLQGKLSNHVMEIVSDNKAGLFPHSQEISFDCSCPDWAGMCKHIAAVLYGIGNRLDNQPELLFRLRGVDPKELVHVQFKPESKSKANLLENTKLSEIFGISLEKSPSQGITKEKSKTVRATKKPSSKKLLKKKRRHPKQKNDNKKN